MVFRRNESHHHEVAKLIQRLSAEGGRRLSLVRFEWDVSGRCEAPVLREIYARPPADSRVKIYGHNEDGVSIRGPGRELVKNIVVRPGKSKTPLSVDMIVKCRKCRRCLAERAYLWSGRAQVEIAMSSRTWFGTFTLSQSNQHLMYLRARKRMLDRSVQLDDCSISERFRYKHVEIGKEFTKYFKRIRKKTGLKFKYLLIAEYHRSGEPHYHALLHEQSPDQTITWRDWSQKERDKMYPEWPLGFTKFNLIEDSSDGRYICKYLSKSSVARVRASLRYGLTPWGIVG